AVMKPISRAMDIMNQNAGPDGLWLAGVLFIAKVIAGTMPAMRQLIDSNPGKKVLESARIYEPPAMPRINRDWKIFHPKPKPKAYSSAISALLGRWNKLAFKRGACLRKMYIGSQGRFSTDLDFTGIGEHDHEDVILEMMPASDQPF